MIDYNLSWIFYFQYNQKNASAKAFFSKTYEKKFSLDKQLFTYDDEELKLFIHKYDYRKLAYFSNHEVKGYFDTKFRFSIEHQKGYLRTQAICQTTKEGFSCLLFNEKDLVKMQHFMGKHKVYPTSSSMSIVDLDTEKNESIPFPIHQVKRQIVELLDREIKIV